MQQITNRQKILNYLGLAQRAGMVISGEEMVLDGVRRGKVLLVFLASDVGENNEKSVTDKCKFYHVVCHRMFDREELSQSIGKLNRVVIGITDRGFVRSIEKLI